MARNQRIYCLTTSGEQPRAVCFMPTGEEVAYELIWAEDLGEDLPETRGTWQELAKNGADLTALLPSKLGDLMQAPLPPLKRSELELAILGLVRKEQGAQQGNWLVAHRQLAATGEGAGPQRQQTCNILFANQTDLQGPLDQLGEHSIRPLALTTGAVTLDAMYRRHLERRDDGDDITAWSLVYLGPEECFLVIGDRRGPLIIRALPTDLSAGEDIEEYLDRLTTEIERSTFFAQRGQVPVHVNRIVITGNPHYTDPLLRNLSEFEIKQERWRPEKGIVTTDEMESWDLILPLAGATYAESRERFSLLPIRPEDGLGWKARRLAMVAMIALAVLSLPAIFAVSFLLERSQQRIILAQTEQLEHTREAVELAAVTYLRDASLLSRQSFLEELGPGRTNLAGFLRDLSLRTPGSVELLAMNVDRTNQDYRIKIRGQVEKEGSDRAQREFIEFRESLRRSPYLRTDREPSFLEISVAEQTDSGNSVVNFTLEYRIREVRSDS